VALAGCAPFSSILGLPVALPDIPDPWAETFAPLQCRLAYPGVTGGTAEMSVRWDQGQHMLEAPKASWMPVIGEPRAAGLTLPPCGGLFPYDLDREGVLRLQWVRGPPARLLLRLWEAVGARPWFNGERFCREAELRLDDPWLLDTERVSRSILDGTFRVTDIRSLPVHEYRLSLGAGCWFAESPFSAVYEADARGDVVMPLGDGFHRIYRLSSPRRWEVMVWGGDFLLLERGADAGALLPDPMPEG
jgi:hypothetical protein